MADPLTPTSGFQLHQVLHGYADGHRQITASTALPSSDARLMLQLSDRAGLAARIPDGGYLTGYPLSSARFYVVARTWGAPELPRPGCVWTHSLLVAFEDLAQIEALDAIDGLFRRPNNIEPESYAAPIALLPRSHSCSWGGEDLELMRRVVAGLYLAPASTIVAQPAACVARDDIVLAVWSQQWPRLRRSFRFATFAVEDRSADSAPFDLQFLANDLVPRPRLRNMVDVDSRASALAWPPWLDTAVDDIASGGRRLRGFLRQYGGELPGGREVFGLLCDLYDRVERSGYRGAAAEAMAIVDAHVGGKQLLSLRRLIVERALDSIDWREPDAVAFVVRHRRLVAEDTWRALGGHLGPAVLLHDPAAFLDSDLADDEALLGAAVERADEPTLVAAIERAPALAARIFAYRPGLLALEALWRAGVAMDRLPLQQLVRGREQAAAIVRAAIAGGRSDQAGHLKAAFGAQVLLEGAALAAGSGLSAQATRSWLREAARDADAVLQFLGSSPQRSLEVLDRLAEVFGPGPSTRSFESGWFDAFGFACAAEPGRPQSALASVMVARLLQARDRRAVSRTLRAIAPVYSAVAGMTLPEAQWSWIEPHLGWTSLWWPQTRLERLTRALADRIADERPPLELLLDVMPEINAQAHLLRCLCATSRGRRYIEAMLGGLDAVPDNLGERARLLRRIADDSEA